MATIEELEARAAKIKEKAAKKPLLERQIEGPVKAYARSKKMYVRKFVSVNNRSVPDNIFSTPKGTVFFIEFKKPGGKPTKAQEEEHREMRACRMKVHVIDNVAAGKTLIDDYLDLDTWA